MTTVDCDTAFEADAHSAERRTRLSGHGGPELRSAAPEYRGCNARTGLDAQLPPIDDDSHALRHDGRRSCPGRRRCDRFRTTVPATRRSIDVLSQARLRCRDL